ncbi:probable insulin-like peptide 5 [Harmonia axyridis]|uniref:probable insulin-like peptide 5 n=1 Tax=Harmonia axyridis TaxID=115357 RepID=UPI001E27738A|nr:probable insulin-like peptide 5 [Harmonia axyridis]
MISQLFFALAISSVLVSESSCAAYEHGSMRVCGSRLVTIMSLVCDDLNNSQGNKRSVNWSPEASFQYPDFRSNALSAAGYHWMDSDVNSFIPMRHQRGIIEACCDKACSIDKLRSFCPIY